MKRYDARLRRTVTCLVLAAALVVPAAARAFPCEADIKKLCPDVRPGGGRIQACLKEHVKELSPECAAHYEKTSSTRGAMADKCRTDIARFCASVAPGQGGVAACLEKHRDNVSAECKAQLTKEAPGKAK
jgi:hypothetical protein